MSSIAVDAVSKRIGHSWALRDITLEVERGEIFGVFGRSGSGKSAMLRLISGLDHPTSGSVMLQSTGSEDQSWLDAQVSIALQKPGLVPDLTVAENLRLFASLWNTQRKGRLGRTAMFIELLGLSEVRNRRVKQLPDGLKAAAEVARALIARSEIVAIDGLIERLDRPTRRRVWEYILASKRHGVTFVIGTASAEQAEMCDRLAVLSHGKLAFVGTSDKLKSAIKNEMVVVESIRNPLLKSKLKERFGASVMERNGAVEFRSREADADIARILSEAHSDVGCVYLRHATLDDALDRIEGEL